jgi:hypothetical protein
VDGGGSFLEGEEFEDGAVAEVGVEHAASVVRGKEEVPQGRWRSGLIWRRTRGGEDPDEATNTASPLRYDAPSNGGMAGRGADAVR